MKRRPQTQEADLFSYAASKTSALIEEPPPRSMPASRPKPTPIPKAAPIPKAMPVPNIAPQPKATLIPNEQPQSESEPQSKADLQPTTETVVTAIMAEEPRGRETAIDPLPASAFGRARFARSLVVSIHDVSPLNREVTERIMSELREVGVLHVVLLVVPNHHCKEYFLDHPEFCQWLREQAQAGHEIVVHGYHHRRDQRPGETFRQKLTTQYYTAGEGEFYDIAGADALRVISQARQEFRKIGIDTKGFVAPAWLLSEGADRALQRLGVCYTTRLGGLFDYTTGTHHHSQSLVWSTRSAWRRVVSLMWNAYLFQKLNTTPLLRISIHPPDIRYTPVWRQIKGLAARALKDRVPTTFINYLNLK